MRRSDFENKEEIQLRDYLALERTRLANERTLFSYLRTALYLTLGGIAFLQLQEFRTIKWLAPVCFVLSVVILVTGIIKYFSMRKSLNRYYTTSQSKKDHIEP